MRNRSQSTSTKNLYGLLQPLNHPTSLASRMKSLFRTRPVLFQGILITCLILTIIRLYPLFGHVSMNPKAYSLTFSIASSAARSPAHFSPPASNPTSSPAFFSSTRQKLPSRPAKKQDVPRPAVPHPLSPLPPSPPSSADICTLCGCSPDKRIQREFNAADELVFKRLPNQTISVEHVDGSSAIENQIWSSIRDIYCQHPLLSSEAAVDLLDRSLPSSTSLPGIIAARINNLQVGLPTQYIFTKTSAFGRTGELRPHYFRRHVKAINGHLLNLARRNGKYLVETEEKWGTGRRQLVWIVIEDGEFIAADVKQVLSQSGLAFIYMAYGPTRRYGNAQQNAAYALIHRLSRTIFGHGPILSIDDDGKVLSELFDIAWRVREFGAWPMGNLGPTGWEGPEYDPETLQFLTWRQAPQDDRPFPLDNGAFAFSSEVFGKNFRLTGPRYWPTDYPGGESEFVSQIISKQESVEPLCYNCRVAWHNQKLTEDCIQNQPSCQEL